VIDTEELLGQLHAYANSQRHSFVTLQQMARESAAAIEELRVQIAARDAALQEIIAMDPKGIRADDLGRSVRIARQAMNGTNDG
jgi:cytochrome c553